VVTKAITAQSIDFETLTAQRAGQKIAVFTENYIDRNGPVGEVSVLIEATIKAFRQSRGRVSGPITTGNSR
jgi:hypothetical protein